MPILTALLLILAVLATSTLSGVFGMVGGMALLWILLLILPVTTAIATQGILQLTANLSRAYFSRQWIDWRIIRFSTIGMVVAVSLLSATDYTPDVAIVSITVGLLPIFCYIPRHWLSLNAERPFHALLCGFLGGGLNVGVGVAGPIVDIFFTRTTMDRRKIIGTKATMQVFSHVAKIIFYSSTLFDLSHGQVTAIGLAMPFSIFGSILGHRILSRMTNDGFRRGTVFLITGVGLFFLGQGIWMLFYSDK